MLRRPRKRRGKERKDGSRRKKSTLVRKKREEDITEKWPETGERKDRKKWG